MNKLASQPKAQSGIQSLARAFSLLETIARNPAGISLTKLSSQVGLHNSTVFHLVRTMVTLGYVRQAEDSKRYRIGGPLFYLAAAALEEVELVGLVDPYVRELAIDTGETCHFAVQDGRQIVIVAKSEGVGVFRLSDRVGGTRPGYCTALGKVFLAALKPTELENYIHTQEFKAYTPNTITDPARLRKEIEKICAAGLAFDDTEYHAELRCVAVPVHDFTQQVIGAIGISGPVWRISLQSLRSRANAVAAAARRLSAELGFREELLPGLKCDGSV